MKKIILTATIVLGFASLALAQTRKSKNKKEHFLATGEVFKCNIDAKVEDGIGNSIKVTAEKSCDVAIRLVDKETDVCIRYAFINAGESYTIDDIPVGKYYVKVGLGKGWFWEDTTIHCAGGFWHWYSIQRMVMATKWLVGSHYGIGLESICYLTSALIE